MTQRKHSTNITIWDNPTVRIASQYGDVSWEQWCHKEIERMHALGRPACLVEKDGLLAIGRPQTSTIEIE